MTHASIVLPGTLLVLCAGSLPATALGVRFTSITVELNGERVLEGMAGDNGLPGPYTVWRYLNKRSLRPVDGFTVQPEGDSPSKAVLRGDVLVKVRYGAEVRTAELPLIAAPDGWLIDPAWVEANGPAGNAADEARKVKAYRERQARERYLAQVAVFVVGVVCVAALVGLAYVASRRIAR